MNLATDRKIRKALADKTRLQIYDTSRRTKGVHSGRLCGQMRGLTPSTASLTQPLKFFRRADLANASWRVQFVLNRAEDRGTTGKNLSTRSVAALGQKRKIISTENFRKKAAGNGSLPRARFFTSSRWPFRRRSGCELD